MTGGCSNITPLTAIVDDDKTLVALLKKAFSMYGVPIAFVAYDGFEAVELFKKAEKKPDTIIMDYDMPGQNGIDAARQILDSSPGVKIVFLTGVRMNHWEALSLGNVTILDKPTSIRILMDAISKSA